MKLANSICKQMRSPAVSRLSFYASHINVPFIPKIHTIHTQTHSLTFKICYNESLFRNNFTGSPCMMSLPSYDAYTAARFPLLWIG